MPRDVTHCSITLWHTQTDIVRCSSVWRRLVYCCSCTAQQQQQQQRRRCRYVLLGYYLQAGRAVSQMASIRSSLKRFMHRVNSCFTHLLTEWRRVNEAGLDHAVTQWGTELGGRTVTCLSASTECSSTSYCWSTMVSQCHTPTSAEISTGCQSISVSSTNYLYSHIKHCTQDSRVIWQTYLISVDHLELCDPLTLTFLLFLPVVNLFLHLELFVYLRLITGTLFLWICAHPIVLLLSSTVLNLTFLLLPITSSHSHASASDSTFDFWRYINFSLINWL